jgi:hypothetical protein
MFRIVIPGALVVASVLAMTPPASADSMRCRSVNGNVTCAGDGAVSCQTVNGQRVCVSGKGDVVQSFGAGARDGAEDEGDDDDRSTGPPPSVRSRPQPRSFLLERDGARLHLRTGDLTIDRN